MVPMTGHAGRAGRRRARSPRPPSRAALGSLGEMWSGQILPEVREHLGFWDSFDLEGATRAAFAAHLERDVGAPAARLGAALRDRAARLPRDQRVRRALPRPVPRRRPAGLLPAARGPAEHDRRGRPGAVGAQPPRDRRAARSARCSLSRAAADVLRRAVRDAPRAAPSSPSSRPTSTATAAAPTSGRSSRRAGPRTRRPSSSACRTSSPHARERGARRHDRSLPPPAREHAIADARERLRDYPAQIVGQFEAMLARRPVGVS